jgi:hypothetical protein
MPPQYFALHLTNRIEWVAPQIVASWYKAMSLPSPPSVSSRGIRAISCLAAASTRVIIVTMPLICLITYATLLPSQAPSQHMASDNMTANSPSTVMSADHHNASRPPRRANTSWSSADHTRCTSLPRHLSCIAPTRAVGASPRACKIRYVAASELACSGSGVLNTSNLTEVDIARGLVVGGRMCPCAEKRVAIVHNVIITAGTFNNVLDQMFAFTPLKDEAIQAAGPSQGSSWALIAASVDPWIKRLCHRTPSRAEVTNLNMRLDSYLKGHSKVHARTLPQSAQLTTATPPWTCTALARKYAATAPQSATDGTARVPADVFFGLEGFADIAGHAMEVLVNAIGQYITDGLDKQGVPWLVPCSDEWVGSRRPLVWVQFFLELNSAGLGFPVYPVDYYKYLLTDRRDVVLYFDRVYFASSYLSYNMLCFKPIIARALWPLAAKTALPVVGTASVAYMKHSPLKSIRVANVTSDRIHTPGRAFQLTANFIGLMSQHNVTLMDNGPLLERMWAVNHAELIVTTWGSAATIASLLLLPQSLLASLNVSHAPQRRRMLVYVQELYCYEATALFDVPRQTLCRDPPRTHRRQPSKPLPARPHAPRRTRTLRGGLFRSQGSMNDFVEDGEGAANNFCVMYVFLSSLSQALDSDFTFQCDGV